MSILQGKHILIGISASIAAYKIPLLVRLFRKAGAEVQVVMTPASKDFVTPLTLSTLSGNPSHNQAFDSEDGSWNSHIELAEWADVQIIAPASANTMGKMVNGIADNLLLTTYLSARSDVFVAPAMDLDMYKHPSTKANVVKLISFGHYIIEPNEGELASGLCGAGRLEEPEVIFEIIQDYFKKKSSLTGVNALVSAGPTYEAIDPVRYIGNHSSGKMGFALAQELADRGAHVELIAGPVALQINHSNISRTDVVSASEMYNACHLHFPHSDLTIMSAAIADFTPEIVSDKKIKKENDKPTIALVDTKDVLKSLGEMKTEKQTLVGFALETDNEVENAISKLRRKNLDLIVLNSLNDKGAGFGHNTNKVTIINNKEEKISFDLKSKTELAVDIVDYIEKAL